MGRIRTKFVKGLAKQLVAKNPDKFGTDFKANVQALKDINIMDEKFMRNKVAGYIVKVVGKKRF
ncbi:MAG: 30S ribosomal protein S17e [Candidatus Aenigmatarchaeota archaeon]